MLKYRPLHDFLRAYPDDTVTRSFPEIERLLGNRLPASAYKYPAWWANEIKGRHVQADAWIRAGWQASVDLVERAVTFRRTRLDGKG